jgi:hypothetical protein
MSVPLMPLKEKAWARRPCYERPMPASPVHSPRVTLGLERLRAVAPQLKVELQRDASIATEGFRLAGSRQSLTIAASSDTGLLYGCLEAIDRLNRNAPLACEDAPVFTLRGPCIGIQKTYLLPGRKVYEYPYTRELFPFFYDRAMWSTYLDELLRLRFNTLYLWNGHPFASFVRVPGYEYAVEVSPEQFAENVSTLRWLTSECDRRGIWLLQSFYSLLVPEGFAKHHGCDTQLTAPTPAASDYTRKAIARFVADFPGVGLLPCLGEALQGIENQSYWCNEVILAGIKDGLAQSGRTDEPPVVIRTHATDPRKIIPAALKHYSNLYTEQKYNGESLTTSEPRGVRQALHLEMSKLGSTHVANVHILANLEPFRYGAQRFIRECMVAARDRLGCKGLHLYPLAYWNWPHSPDGGAATYLQWDRDWIWFEAWARYAWNPDRDLEQDRKYWVQRLSERFGNAAPHVLDAYNDAGECAPRLLRRFGITEGNRQTMSLGMTLDQLVNPERYRPFPELWESQAPPGERIAEYVQRELAGEPHVGETPVSIIEEACAFADRAVQAIERAVPSAGRDEFAMIANDCRAIRAMTYSFAGKVRAAIHVLRHRTTKGVVDLIQAEKHLASSLDHFRELERLTRGTYAFANTMQTSQRRIPVPGGVEGKPANFHWTQLLPFYEKEYADFARSVQNAGETGFRDESAIPTLPKVKVKLLSGDAQTFDCNSGSRAFVDVHADIESIAPELAGLQGIRVKHDHVDGRIEFDAPEPVQVLVGYFQSDGARYLKMPDLETDAAAVDLVDDAPVLRNAITIQGHPAVNVHAWHFPAGQNTLDLRGRGLFVVVGIVPEKTHIEPRDCGRGGRA